MIIPKPQALPSLTLDKLALEPVHSTHTSKAGGGASPFTMVSTPLNGKRLTFSDELCAKIGADTSVQVQISPLGLAVAAAFPGKHADFTLRQSGTKRIVYCASLVDEITARFQLDYSTRSSISFFDVEYFDLDGITVALIPIDQKAHENATTATASDVDVEATVDADVDSSIS